jgi:hypothetical protein
LDISDTGKLPVTEYGEPRTGQNVDYYRESIVRHVRKRSTMPLVQLDRSGRIVLYLTTATDDDVAYWVTKFPSCRRLSNNHIEFVTRPT